MSVRIGVLGPVQVAGRDAGGIAMRALLTALVLGGADSARSIGALADEVWGEDQPQNPKAALQTLVSRARAAGGGDLVRSTPGGYALGTEDTDLHRVRALLAEAETLADADPRRVDLLEAAAALWRGEPGADLGAAPAAEELGLAAEGLRCAVHARLAAAYSAAGRDAEAVALLAALADAAPFDEGAHRALMQALAGADRVADALAVYADLRGRLRDELGSSPGAAITELHTRLLRESDDGPRVRVGLQAAPNELIGRDDALREARAILGRSRLLTILGAGGLGKTRLAQALAGESTAPVVVVVPLAGVRADAGVPIAIAAALGISENTPGGRLAESRPRPDLAARIVGALADRATVLVLDNCEQVIDGVARWSADLLAAVPSLRIVATSRTPLAIAAEQVLPLEPLGIEADAAAPAVRLFVERAHAARPGATLDLAVVARLCERLDGLPLAIELAAARVRTMTPEQIEERLEDRFALLRSGDRSAPQRHRTLQAVIEWSWDLLAEDARHALALLSVLPGGFSASTAAAVLGSASADDLLDQLVSHSLLMVLEADGGSDVRFRMLETVREFGHDRLDDAGAAERAWEAVIGWALRFADERGRRTRIFPGGLTAQGHREITREHDNLVHVMRHLMAAGRAAEAVRLFIVLGQSWFIRGSFTEFLGYGPPMVQAVETMDPEGLDADLVVMALAMGSLGCLISGDPVGPRGIALVRARVEAAGAELSSAWRLLSSALVASARGYAVGTVDPLAGAEDPHALLAADLLLSHAAENNGEAGTAMEAAKSAWERARALGEQWAEGMAADLAAQLAAQTNHPTEAMVWLERSAEVFVEYDADDQLRHQEWVRGGALLGSGRAAEARALFRHLSEEGGLSQDGMELTSIGDYGLAEADLLDGDVASAKASFARAMASFAEPVQRRSPWYLMAAAGYLSAAVRDLGIPAEEAAVWERALRTRTIAVCRLRREGVDRPVLGTALLGWSAWALRQPGREAQGVEALGLAEALGGRQNMPTLDLGTHVADAERIVGASAVAEARAAAARLDPRDRVRHGLAVLGYHRG